jgi:hypothetical protein
MNVRRSIAAGSLGAAMVLGTAMAATAADDPTYPPSTPSPTSIGKVLPTGAASVAGVSLAADQADNPGSLPFTGADVARWGGAGLVLLGAGGVLLVAGRRRGARSY